MCVLVRRNSTIQHRMPVRARIGRLESNDLVILDDRVSEEHALVVWQEPHWVLRDLGSTNGTMVDGEPLRPPEGRILQAESRIVFGGVGEEWVVEAVLPPCAFARSDHGHERVEEAGRLVLGKASVLNWSAAEARWELTTRQGVEIARDRQHLWVEGVQWTLYLPTTPSRTRPVPAKATRSKAVRLAFAISADQEDIQLEVRQGTRGMKFNHYVDHELIRVLAQYRLDDVDVEASEQGWRHRDDIIRDAGCKTRNKLNGWIFRIRERWQEEGWDGDVIERRKGSGEIRLAIPTAVIHGLKPRKPS